MKFVIAAVMALSLASPALAWNDNNSTNNNANYNGNANSNANNNYNGNANYNGNTNHNNSSAYSGSNSSANSNSNSNSYANQGQNQGQAQGMSNSYHSTTSPQAPAVSAGANSCAVGVGVGGMFNGPITLGANWNARNCQILREAEMLQRLGGNGVALKHMTHIPRVKRTLQAPAPAAVPEASIVAASQPSFCIVKNGQVNTLFRESDDESLKDQRRAACYEFAVQRSK